MTERSDFLKWLNSPTVLKDWTNFNAATSRLLAHRFGSGVTFPQGLAVLTESAKLLRQIADQMDQTVKDAS